MKKTLILLLLISSTSLAQQIVNLGKDTTFCGSLQDNLKIGDNLSILGSNVDVKYLWSCTYLVGSHTFTGKDFLDVVTIPNPTLVDKPLDSEWLKFVLSVTRNDSVFKDSINIRVSQFGFSLAYEVYRLSPGDSASFYADGVGGGIAPLTFLQWKPTIGLKDSLAENTICYQTLTTTGKIGYSAFYKDSVGCTAENLVYEIWYKDPVSSVEGKLDVSRKIYSFDQKIFFENGANEEVEISLFSPDGRLVHFITTKSNSINIPKNLRSDELLICKVYYKNSRLIYNQKLIVK